MPVKLIDKPINLSFFGIAVRKADCPTNQQSLMRLVLGASGPFFDSLYGVCNLSFPNAVHPSTLAIGAAYRKMNNIVASWLYRALLTDVW
jgi:hypothetical protein